MSFFKRLLSSILGTIIGIILISLLFFVIIFSVIGSFNKEEVVVVDEKAILHLNLNQPIVERGLEIDETEFNLGAFMEDPTLGLNDIIENLEKAKNDDRIKGIYLNVSQSPGSASTMFDIREALLDFKEDGKWIVAYAESYSQGAYYLASAADEIYLYPEGGMDWTGLSANLSFLKGLLDELEIDVQVLRGPDNKYKSAVEPLMYDKMSEPNREQYSVLLNDIWRIMLEGISEERNISIEKLNEMADSLAIRMPDDALENGFVDGIKYQDQVMQILAEKIEVEENIDEGNDNVEHFVSFADYQDVFVSSKNKSDKKSWEKDRVAVIYAVGAIEGGEGSDQIIGSDRIARALRKARNDKKVKAIVLRVNSPGGSALASDVIWRETELIKEAGIPFVVSMGDVAASGGYYIACGADVIYANANTITGSIGVFGIVPNMKNFYNNKLHITFDGVETNEHSSMTFTDALDDKQLEAVNEMIEGIYYQFIGLVAEGRGMSDEDVDAIAQGRVWTGEDALEIGLVDELGDLNDAINKAAELAGIDDYRVKTLPKMIDPFQAFMDGMGGVSQAELLKETLAKELPTVKKMMELENLINMKGIQARLPYILEINY